MNGNYSVEDICSTKNVKLIRECIDRYPEYADMFLERSCKHGVLKMVKYLVEELHISINKTSKGGESLHLCHAIQNNHFDIGIVISQVLGCIHAIHNRHADVH